MKWQSIPGEERMVIRVSDGQVPRRRSWGGQRVVEFGKRMEMAVVNMYERE